jgi:hypothetical protein
MNNVMRSDSDSESIKQGIYALTTTPIVQNRRAATIGNVHQELIYYPAISEVSSHNRSITTSTSMWQ